MVHVSSPPSSEIGCTCQAHPKKNECWNARNNSKQIAAILSEPNEQWSDSDILPKDYQYEHKNVEVSALTPTKYLRKSKLLVVSGRKRRSSCREVKPVVNIREERQPNINTCLKKKRKPCDACYCPDNQSEDKPIQRQPLERKSKDAYCCPCSCKCQCNCSGNYSSDSPINTLKSLNHSHSDSTSSDPPPTIRSLETARLLLNYSPESTFLQRLKGKANQHKCNIFNEPLETHTYTDTFLSENNVNAHVLSENTNSRFCGRCGSNILAPPKPRYSVKTKKCKKRKFNSKSCSICQKYDHSVWEDSPEESSKLKSWCPGNNLEHWNETTSEKEQECLCFDVNKKDCRQYLVNERLYPVHCCHRISKGDLKCTSSDGEISKFMDIDLDRLHPKIITLPKLKESPEFATVSVPHSIIKGDQNNTKSGACGKKMKGRTPKFVRPSLRLLSRYGHVPSPKCKRPVPADSLALRYQRGVV